jgi:hypothetical protein|tara:strand:+ start:106 stop:543 length:438 start_codon:yes stop_codon:yes gene_type:complete
MEEEFYAIIKLISGEEIFSLVSVDENDGDSIVIMQSPVTMKSFNHHGNSLMKIKPWIELSTDDIFVIKYDRIITMTETKDQRIINVYNRYLSDEEDDVNPFDNKLTSKVNISEKMGYLNSVEESRKKLEDIFNIPPTDPDIKDIK